MIHFLKKIAKKVVEMEIDCSNHGDKKGKITQNFVQAFAYMQRTLNFRQIRCVGKFEPRSKNSIGYELIIPYLFQTREQLN